MPINSFIGFNTNLSGDTLIVTPTTTPSTKDEALTAIAAITEYMKSNAVKLNISDNYLNTLMELIK